MICIAELKFYEKRILSEKDIVEMKIWKVSQSEDFPDGVKYSFVYIHNKERVLGYDNERGKGHHKHFKGKEMEIGFEDPESLLLQFKKEVEGLMKDYNLTK